MCLCFPQRQSSFFILLLISGFLDVFLFQISPYESGKTSFFFNFFVKLNLLWETGLFSVNITVSAPSG